MKKIYLILAAAVMLFGACEQAEMKPSYLPDEMLFDAFYQGTRATGDSFEQGDAMGVYVTKYVNDTPVPLQLAGNYGNNSKAVFDGSLWRCTPAIFWEEGKFDIYAYYPYAHLSSVDEYPFSVVLDQSVEETSDMLSGYEASDFLWAKATGVSQSESVALTFSHKMSKIVVNLVKGEEYTGELPSDAVVRIHNTVPEALIDLATGIVIKNGYGSAQTITARKVSDGVYTAIVVPQRLDTKRPLVEVLASDVSYLMESSFVFRAGTQHTINITLSDNPDKVKIEIGGEVDNWTE